MNDAALFIAVFLACVVEAVEATTIVLAAGVARNWRSAFTGVLVALVVLAAAVAVAGPAITLLPLGVLRLVVGALLLVFGLQWTRKAILRAAGYKPLHDEAQIYSRQIDEAQKAVKQSRFGVADWYAFTLSFKGVLLEGLEVVFIVLTFGTNEHNVPLAALAAGVAVVVVVILGAIVRGPLSRVPENTLKFIVGILLTTFGTFWGSEGAGVNWPGDDAALLVLAPSIAVFALLIVVVMRAWRASRSTRADSAADVAEPVAAPKPAAAPPPAAPARKTFGSRLRAFGLFWYDFLVGDDWLITAGVVVGLALAFWLSTVSNLAWLVGVAMVVLLVPLGVRRALR